MWVIRIADVISVKALVVKIRKTLLLKSGGGDLKFPER